MIRVPEQLEEAAGLHRDAETTTCPGVQVVEDLRQVARDLAAADRHTLSLGLADRLVAPVNV